MLIREAGPGDLPFLEEITLAAYNWSEPRFTLEWVRSDPMAQRYLAGFPRAGDLGLIGAVDGRDVGAVWARALPADRAGYGFVAPEVPELSAGVLAGARGRGVGSALLDALITRARQRSLPGLSLSVEDGNAARRLYERAGFTVVGREGNSDTMLLRL
ncbi:GNAT family N-acetyltransferase [Paractinoplanes lichenicola]|uniref:GNAT family N-acetyltransferase n=1 Tax=Paractinoplanes lichenicola TaxID=2802976 RepID=A0ABS1VST8_9ACTN|nr:GNAT family N-acetyltransferase [Actinoplanes lichenicola]MBL7257531.1 GNAT family N-acetyltransferase [Actinoplanes lichenicola]